MSYIKPHYHIYADACDTKKQKSLFRTLEQGITPSSQSGYIHINEQNYLNCASNDYMGLKDSAELLQAGINAAKKYGNGSASARSVSGQFDFYTQTEQKLARFKNKESAIFGASGFQINSCVLSALFNPELFPAPPKIFFDKYNHASLYFAVRHAGITPIRYRHNDLNHLHDLLKKHCDGVSPVFIVTESLFSMDGDILDIPRFLAIAKQYNAFTIVDDAHGVGVYGQNGAGLTANYPDIDVVLGTASKALGGFGGYAACRHDVADYLRNFASGLIYSTTPPPFIWGVLNESLTKIQSMHAVRDYVKTISDYARYALQKAGFDILTSTSHIIPIVFGDNDTVLKMEKKLRHAQFFIKSIRTPTVPNGTARLRFSITPHISQQHIDKMIKILRHLTK